jgi:hypothetical protein
MYFISRGLQSVFFSVMTNIYIGIFYLNRKLLPCRKTKQSKKKYVDSGIMKKCDEIDLW